MPIKAPHSESAPPIAAGSHQAVCYGCVAIGTQPSEKFQPRPKIMLIWELPHERGDFGDKKNVPRAISQRYTLSLGKKATLRHVLENWRGRAFTEEELSTFEIDRLIGANCLLTVQHTSSGGKTYANVTSVAPLAKGMTKFTAENPPLYFNLDEAIDKALVSGGQVEFPANMPEWMVTLAKGSDEYRAFAGGKSNPPPSGDAPDKAPVDEDVPF